MEKREKPKVSIVIPSWFKEGQDGRYGKAETYWIAQECLKRLIEVTPRELYELIIVDNGSTLKEEDLPRERADKENWLKIEDYWNKADILVRNETNLGFGGGMNKGLAVTNGEYVVQINNDILFWEGWLEELLDVYNQNLTPPVGMVMPALERSGVRFPEILKIKKEDVDMKTNAGKYGAHAQFGSCWCIRKDLLEKLHEQDGFYFDPQFAMLFREDRDLYQRVYALGLETYRTHNTRVHHVGNLSVSKIANRKEISTNNRELYAKKWEGREK